MKLGAQGEVAYIITFAEFFSQLVQGLRSSDTPKIVVSLSQAASPLQQCCTTAEVEVGLV